MYRILTLAAVAFTTLHATAATPCVAGMAGSYPCNGLDLRARVTVADLLANEGNDSWGWTDPQTGSEYALMGTDANTSFVDITNPDAPVIVGFLPTQTVPSSWRDIKVYADHAYVTSEAAGHGMQVFDLNQLRDVVTPPVVFSATSVYNEFGDAHNIAINEESGYAYIVGAGGLTTGDNCSGGLHMIDLSVPASPQFIGCFSQDGYTHDAQCVVYRGPDPEFAFQGREICFAENEDTLTIVDVTNKAAPVMLSRTSYQGVAYAHQGWLTENHRYIITNDELDEQDNGHFTKHYVWDLADLRNPQLIATPLGPTPAIDHNMYIRGNYAFQANYRAGVRIYDIGDVANGSVVQHAWFDTYPANDNPSFNGVWNVYPYFPSGNIIASDIEGGLFVLTPTNLGADNDNDYVRNDQDNCLNVANADQRDTNGDGYGNICDGDLNDNLVINTVDLGIFKAAYLTSDPDADLNGNGVVNVVDLGIMKTMYLSAPGPSGVAP